MSYHGEDRGVAERLAADLRTRGFEVWLYSESLSCGADFEEQILRAIDRTLENGAMVALVSWRSVESEWILQELKYALAQEGRVVPCLLGPPPPNMPPELERIQWIDFARDYAKGFQCLLRALEH